MIYKIIDLHTNLQYWYCLNNNIEIVYLMIKKIYSQFDRSDLHWDAFFNTYCLLQREEIFENLLIFRLNTCWFGSRNYGHQNS